MRARPPPGFPCAERIRELCGGDPARDEGVLHVASAWRSPTGALLTLRIGPDAPRSEGDAFVLDLARARADAIVTTGKVLRDEPQLRHALHSRDAAALRAWRTRRLGREAAPRSVVLTSGERGLDLAHPVLRQPLPGAPAPLVVTGRRAARRLAGPAREAGVEVVGRPAPGLRDAIELLLARGARTLCIEAGAATTTPFYAECASGRARGSPGMDELLLAVYEAPDLAPSARGGALPDEGELARHFGGPPRSATLELEVAGSGRWTFLRWRRPR